MLERFEQETEVKPSKYHDNSLLVMIIDPYVFRISIYLHVKNKRKYFK